MFLPVKPRSPIITPCPLVTTPGVGTTISGGIIVLADGDRVHPKPPEIGKYISLIDRVKPTILPTAPSIRVSSEAPPPFPGLFTRLGNTTNIPVTVINLPIPPSILASVLQPKTDEGNSFQSYCKIGSYKIITNTVYRFNQAEIVRPEVGRAINVVSKSLIPAPYYDIVRISAEVEDLKQRTVGSKYYSTSRTLLPARSNNVYIIIQPEGQRIYDGGVFTFYKRALGSAQIGTIYIAKAEPYAESRPLIEGRVFSFTKRMYMPSPIGFSLVVNSESPRGYQGDWVGSTVILHSVQLMGPNKAFVNVPELLTSIDGKSFNWSVRNVFGSFSTILAAKVLAKQEFVLGVGGNTVIAKTLITQIAPQLRISVNTNEFIRPVNTQPYKLNGVLQANSLCIPKIVLAYNTDINPNAPLGAVSASYSRQYNLTRPGFVAVVHLYSNANPEHGVSKYSTAYIAGNPIRTVVQYVVNPKVNYFSQDGGRITLSAPVKTDVVQVTPSTPRQREYQPDLGYVLNTAVRFFMGVCWETVFVINSEWPIIYSGFSGHSGTGGIGGLAGPGTPGSSNTIPSIPPIPPATGQAYTLAAMSYQSGVRQAEVNRGRK